MAGDKKKLKSRSLEHLINYVDPALIWREERY